VAEEHQTVGTVMINICIDHWLIGIFLILLSAHFVFDFMLQSDKMGLNKSKSWKWLSIHCLIYAIGLTFSMWYVDCWQGIVWYLPAFFVSHIAIDGITSRITSYLWQHNERHWFFVVIGFDQLIHYAVILFIFAIAV
jgi:hypothetical protein